MSSLGNAVLPVGLEDSSSLAGDPPIPDDPQPLGVAVATLDEERDPARLTIALGTAVSSLHAFFAMEPRGRWGAELIDPAKRVAIFEELGLSAEILAKLLELVEDVAAVAASEPAVRRFHEKIVATMNRADAAARSAGA